MSELQGFIVKIAFFQGHALNPLPCSLLQIPPLMLSPSFQSVSSAQKMATHHVREEDVEQGYYPENFSKLFTLQ